MSASVDAAFRDFVAGDGFSCLAGKGVVNADAYDLHAYGALGSHRSARALARDLGAFAAALPHENVRPRTFVAVFPARPPATESLFEQRLWQQLQRVHDNEPGGTPWDAATSDDPEDPHFGFSVGGHAFFIVGLHPLSSRISRRFRWPALVFNPRSQFDRLRAHGSFDRLRDKIREREVALQGSLNPNLADFGERSEARQYSGRAAEPEWRCPFHRRDA